MATYIIRGWQADALERHNFAHRESSRGNMYSKWDYNAQAEEHQFEAENDNEAKTLADKNHPELVGYRTLLKVIV
jgi:hypothetical protein